MRHRRGWAVAASLFVAVGVLPASVALAQVTIRQGRAVAPNAPQIILLHAPTRIQPAQDLPVYVSAKAGDADLKEIVWSFENPPYSDTAFGSYRIQPGEEKEVAGYFTLSTFRALEGGTLSNTQNRLIYIKIWARDVQDRSGQVGYFEVTLDLQAQKDLPPPSSTLRFAKNFGVIEGRIVSPIGDGSHP